jgi:ABC-type glycerol-3-phosphate transport system substrate-binding protein
MQEERSMHNAQRWCRLAAGAVIVMLFAAGCGGSSGPEASGGQADGKGTVKGTIRLSWWGAASRNEKTNAVADMFVKAHPGVKIERETTDFGTYWNKLNVQAAGKNMPCVTQTQARQLNDFTKRRVLLPLDPMIKSGAINVKDIPKDILDTGRGPDGKLYMLPYGAAYDALMVNQTFADQAGVGLLKAGYTWDDWRRYLVAAKSKVPKGNQASTLRGGLANYFIAYVQSQGKQLFDQQGKLGFDKDLLVGYWSMWEQLRKAGVTIDAAAQADEPTQPEESYVAQGRVMVDSRPGNALTPSQATLDGKGKGGKLTTLPLPSGPAGSGNVIITSGFSIPTNCTNVPTAAKFIDFWINDPQASKTFASDNGANTNAKLLAAQVNDPALPELKKHELEVYQQMVRSKVPAIVYPPGYQATFESAFTRGYEDVSFGRKSVAQAVDAFFKEANAGLGA